jgi:hypothetical protein
VDGLKRAFRSFKAAFLSESTLSDSLKAHGATIEVAGAWQPLGTRFAKRRQFCGGLATFFPGTDTLESDFSVLKWERDGAAAARRRSLLVKVSRNANSLRRQWRCCIASQKTSLVPGLISQ